MTLDLFQKLTDENIQSDPGATAWIIELSMSCLTFTLQRFMACYVFKLFNNEVIKNASMFI